MSLSRLSGSFKPGDVRAARPVIFGQGRSTPCDTPKTGVFRLSVKRPVEPQVLTHGRAVLECRLLRCTAAPYRVTYPYLIVWVRHDMCLGRYSVLSSIARLCQCYELSVWSLHRPLPPFRSALRSSARRAVKCTHRQSPPPRFFPPPPLWFQGVNSARTRMSRPPLRGKAPHGTRGKSRPETKAQG
jgi:hypothetical protein